MKTAAIFHRFGPYHVARLGAASQVGDVTGIELSSQTHEYAWDQVQSEKLRRITLTDDDSKITTRALVDRLTTTLDDIRPDVLFVNGWSGAIPLASLRWCRRRGVKAVVMSESSAGDEPRVGYREWIKRQIVRCFSAALVGGERHRQYAQQLGVPSDRIFLGYDAVDNHHFKTGADAARSNARQLRQQYHLPERYFLASNRFIAKKNLRTLILAYSEYVKQSGADAWKLVMLGDGPLKPELELLTAELNLNDRVLYPGFQQYDRLPVYYGLAGAFVHASSSEQWGLVVNEAMASGLPVIVSEACGCVTELVQDGVNGFRFKPDSVEELSEKMKKLSLTEILSFTASSLRIISNYGVERFAEGYWNAARSAQQRSFPFVSRFILKGLSW